MPANRTRIHGPQEALSENAWGTAVGRAELPSNFSKVPLRQETGCSFKPNHYEADRHRIHWLKLSGYLRTLAVSLMKIANDIRWLD